MRRLAMGRLTGALLLVALLTAAMAVPTAMVLTAGTEWADRHDAALPPQLVTPPDAQATRIYANDGKTLITTFYDEDRHDVGLADIAPVMQQAIVAAEDTRFFQHGGVDTKGVLRALVSDTSSGRTTQGASTLTMQYVRNVLKDDPDVSTSAHQQATADTLTRKLREAQYAIELEQVLTKRQILQNYLNIVYFGDGAYGIDAAAQHVFGVPASRLDLAQAALLAGIVQSPDQDNPVSGSAADARTRQSYVLAAMVKSGVLTPAQSARAAAEKLTFRSAARRNGCVAAAGGASAGWGFFCDYVRRWWDANPAFGATAQDRDQALRRGGYTVITTLDPSVQAEAERQSRTVYRDRDRRVLPIAVVEPGTGKVLALAVNRGYGTGSGETVNPLITGGGGLHGYPSGSTFKMFTMLAALEAGMPLSTGFDAPATLPTHWPDTGPNSCDGRYCPGNDDPTWMDGFRTMWDGFGRSVNTYFVHLEEQVGPAAVVAEAKKLGISFSAPSDARLAASPDGWGSFTLGVVDTTPLELAEAYATVASGGVYCTPLPVERITDPHGTAIAAGPDCRAVLRPDVARAATDAARCPVGQQSAYGKCDGGTAQQVAAMFRGREVAGKTGSTENNTTETFVGFTSTAVAAGTAADPGDPGDRVGSAVEARVVDAVAHTLRYAVGDSDYPAFIPPSRAIALGG